MKIYFYTIIAIISIAMQVMAADRLENISSQIAKNKQINVGLVKDAIEKGLWNSEKTALALSIYKPGGSVCLVLIKHSNTNFTVVDVSNVENGNFGKLGYPRSYYDRYETKPVEWMIRDDSHYQVVFDTRAWKGDQRYTVTEPLIVKADGTPVWR
jgi:predicted DNA-binding protein